MDYRELLKKYMNHVGEQEGTTFLGTSLNFNPELSDEEKAELRKINDEFHHG